jgi:MOSC domain-containing protein YiiM
MNKSIGKVLFIKVGKVVSNDSLSKNNPHFLSGIKKYPVAKAYLTKVGFKDDEQADTLHHGGETKAVLFFSTNSYKKLNELSGSDFKYDEVAHYGENIVVDGIDESDICVGDILKIGDAEVQVSQPRQPCWKLSANTKTKQMTTVIYNNGLSGWYARVLKEGEIEEKSDIVLVKRAYEKLTIASLNKIIIDPHADIVLTKEALACEALGAAFKASLEGRVKLKDAKNEPFLYHNQPN